MTRRTIIVVLLAGAAGYVMAAATGPGETQARDAAAAKPAPNRLAVVWTSADPGVAHNVCFMYTQAAKSAGWFDEVTLIVWGPSAKLTAEDVKIQAALKKMAAKGVKVQACIVCANNYGVTDDLRKLGIEVKGMGRPLSDMLKSGWNVLTF